MRKFPKHGNHLIGLAGYAGSGKDTVGKLLVESGLDGYPVRTLAFADPMRDIVQLFRGPIQDFRSGHPDQYRKDMQLLGEYGRCVLGPHFWIDHLAERYRKLRGTVEGVVVAITDVRYPNELDWIRECNGQLWWIQRDSQGVVNNHPSETHYGFLRARSDYIIQNNGSIEDLAAAIRHRDKRVDEGTGPDSLSSSDGS